MATITATITATIGDKTDTMNPEFEVLSIDTTKEFNKVPMAELRLIDGDAATGKYKILDSGFFEPGRQINVALKYEDNAKDGGTIFTGIVVGHSLELNRTGPTLTVELADPAVKMTSVRQNVVHCEASDKDIINKLIKNHGLVKKAKGSKPSSNEVNKDTKASEQQEHPKMIQCYTTDWDFMLARAEANGLLVVTNDGIVSVIKPEIAAKAALSLELGKDVIYDFELQANSRGQYGAVSAVGWDISKQKLTEPATGTDFELPQGTYSVAGMAEVVGAKKATLVHPVPVSDTELKAWSSAQLLKSRLALLRGWIKVPGNANIKVGQTIEIKGVGDHFAGKNIISGVRQESSIDGWATHIQIGMDACWFTAQPHVTDTPAAGLLPGVNGLQIGIVQDHKDDPQGQFRMRVAIPAFDNKATVWARLASIDAGPERGVFFRPEPGDEVVVGFLNDDPRQAIVLGAMHSSQKNKAPHKPTPKNGQKGIFTKKKYQLLFDEEKEIVTLSTSKKSKIEIDEKNGRISLADFNGNHITLDKKGVEVASAKDLKIDVKGDVAIKAKGKVEIAGKKVDLI